MTTVNVINISNNNLPKYETSQSAGMDVRADFSRITPQNPIKLYGEGEIIFKGDAHKMTMLRLEPGSRALIPTGLFTAIPEGYEIQVRPRSGLSLKEGLTCANCVGTVDSDYRSEIGVILINLGTETAWIEDGERIAQFVLNKVEQINWNQVDSLDETSRKGGFGHTGTK
jgi:dUTP pyrophosphatase